MILRKALYIICLCSIALLPLAGCSSDDNGTTPDNNNPPTVEFTIDKLAVPRVSDITLTATTDDPDGDPVTVNWQVTRGVLNQSQQGQPSIGWITPQVAGLDTITITAADNKGGSTTITETIKVGWLVSNRIQPPGQTWRAVNSPIIVRPGEDKFVITEGARLVIEAGVEVLFDRRDLEAVVSGGTLEMNGDAVDPVVILPNTKTPEPGWWAGILVASGELGQPGIADLTHARIGYATSAVRGINTADVMIHNCDIKFAFENAVLYEGAGNLLVENSNFTNNERTAIRVESGVLLPESVIIRGDSIAVNGDLSGSTPYEDDAAILINLDDPFGTVYIDISDNEISRNAFPGMQLTNAVFPFVHHNAIFANEFGKSGTRFNIRLTDDFGSQGGQDTIDARCNYWGGFYPNPADSVMIKAGIRDADDNATILVDVIVTPWLSQWPPVSLPPECQ